MTFDEWWTENGWEGDSAYKAARSAWNAAKAPDESAALGLAQDDAPYPELFKHWVTTVYASGMPDVPDEFTRADMAKAFDAGAARYNDLLQSWSDCRGKLQKERNLGDTLRSALKEEAQRSESYLVAYRSATDDLRMTHMLLQESRSREYHAELEREVVSNARGLQCAWPACTGLDDEMAIATALRDSFGFEHDRVIGPTSKWRLHARNVIAAMKPVSQRGTPVRSAEDPAANLAGPEGDARPVSPDQPGHFCGNKETHDFHVYVHDGKPYQCFGAQPWPVKPK